MKTANIIRNVFRVSLIFMVLISGFLCIYAVQKYNNTSTIMPNNQFTRGEFMPVNGGFQQNVPPSNGDMAPPNGNRQFESNNQKQGPDGNMATISDNSQTISNDNLSRELEAGANGSRQPNRGNKNNQSSANNNQSGQSGTDESNSNNNRQRGNNKMPPGQLNNMQGGNGGAKYLQPLTIYSIVFLILSCGMYYLVRYKKIKDNIYDEKIILLSLLTVGVFLRIAASTLMNGHNDINLFKNWAQVAANGLSQFYSNAKQADYPPFYIYILAFIGKLASFSAINPYFIVLLKIPSIATDVVTGYFIYKLGKKYLNSIISLLLAGFYIFNPAIFIDSTFWGQVDSFFTLLIVLAIYLLCEKKYVFSTIMFTIAVLMKPQGIIFIPVLFFELVRKRKIKCFIYASISAIITALIIIIPFSLNVQSPLWIINLYLKTISEYPYASVNAFNFFSLIGANYKNNNSILFIFSYHTIGMLFIFITTLISLAIYIKGNTEKYVSAIALLQIAGVFTFSVGMHERYLFPAVALAIISYIYLKDRRLIVLAIGFSITSYANISAVFFSNNTQVFNYLLRSISFLNVIMVLYLVKVLFDNALRYSLHSEEMSKTSLGNEYTY